MDPTIAPFDTGLNGVNQPVNLLLSKVLWATLGLFCVVVIVFRLSLGAWATLRHVSAVTAISDENNAYNYWKQPLWCWTPRLKALLIYAPLFGYRRARKTRFFGALPTRLQAIFLAIYILSNFGYLLVLDWSDTNRYALCAELRGRSGTLAAVNFIPLVLLAGRNNPLISLLRISFDTYILIHRWIGRTVVVITLIHVSAWAFVQVADGGWDSVGAKVLRDHFIAAGTAGWLALTSISILSLPTVRSAFYETFLNVHILLAFVVISCAWIHCASAGLPLPQLPWVIAAAALWGAERLARLLRLLYFNYSRGEGTTTAVVEALPGSAAVCRVTLRLRRPMAFRPGMHAYLRLGAASPWESHPFSIAWAESSSSSTGTLPVTEGPRHIGVAGQAVDTIHFLVGANSGFTRQLFDAAAKAEKPLRTLAAFEGPYGGHHSLDSYGTVVLFAGATGITHQLGYAAHLVRSAGLRTAAARKVSLVWVVRSADALMWIQPWLSSILQLPDAQTILRVRVFVTEKSNQSTESIDSVKEGKFDDAIEGVSMERGRPNVMSVVEEEARRQIGAMCVTICGPGGLADDVRAAVRNVQGMGQEVDLVEESFSW